MKVEKKITRHGHDREAEASMAEEKFADRPQILKGDIVRVVGEATKEESCHVVSAARDTGVYSDHLNYHYNEEILAIYRFDGLDFKCIWESVGYKFDRLKRIIDEINKTQLTLSVKLKSVNAAMERFAKEAEGKASEWGRESVTLCYHFSW